MKNKKVPGKPSQDSAPSSGSVDALRPANRLAQEQGSHAGLKEINPKTLAYINSLLPGAMPWGAYAMGMACAAVWQIDRTLEIPFTALAGARACSTVEQAQSYGDAGREWATAQPRPGSDSPRIDDLPAPDGASSGSTDGKKA